MIYSSITFLSTYRLGRSAGSRTSFAPTGNDSILTILLFISDNSDHSACRKPDRFLLLKRVNNFPVFFHIYYGPSPGLCLVEGLVELADLRCPVICPLALVISVVHQQCKSSSRPGSRPLQHLQVAIGITKSRRWTASDAAID